MARNLSEVDGRSADDRAWAITAPALGGLLFFRALSMIQECRAAGGRERTAFHTCRMTPAVFFVIVRSLD
jgi:hypothetical protein